MLKLALFCENWICGGDFLISFMGQQTGSCYLLAKMIFTTSVMDEMGNNFESAEIFLK